MGVIKAKKAKKTSKVSKVAKTVTSAVGAVMGGGSKSRSGKRRSRLTPEKLAKKIIMLKLKKKLAKLRGY